MDITPLYDTSITTLANASDIETTLAAACFEYKYRIADPVQVVILFKSMPTGLGSSWAGGGFEIYPTYASYYTQLVAHASSALDTAALSTTPNTATNPVNGGLNIRLKLPLARVLGMTTNATGVGTNLPPRDNEVSLNTSICKLSPNGDWGFNSGSGTYSNYSVYAVACHEINESLGFSSQLDGVTNGAPTPTGFIGTEDLWRYDINGVRSFSTSSSTAAYFSISGYGQIARFNQTQGGDFHDWYSPGGQTPEVQDATGTTHAIPRLGTAEMDVFDAIGYKILPKPVWLDLGEAAGGTGDYFWAWNTESAAGADVESGGAIMIKGSPTLHHSRIDSTTYGKPVRLVSFNGTTHIVP